ncbi:hypothetical protein [Chryseobacterium sp. c4a]|uniref:hypothetical protein n=1 Tax=Chryseobacterium sp. c4a TaxID=1573582 RepID=UPI001359C33B|nr:hypothetical protein [Chryseobacterium sp. c4a]
MKPKKTLKFSKETVVLLDKTVKKTVNGGGLYQQEITTKGIYCSEYCLQEF